MGLRGPAPKPTAVKELEGNPGKRSLKTGEPKAKIKAPRCPAYLNKYAKQEWNRLVPILLDMRVLTEADYLSLANLCMAASRLRKAEEQLEKTGLLFKTPSGYVQQSPLVGIVTAQMELVTKLSREFGLTPSARTRVASQPAENVEMSLTAKLLSLASRR